MVTASLVGTLQFSRPTCIQSLISTVFFVGFVTTSVLAADADQDNVFKCGIAVAPVTNWIYYDTIYTERYMGLPTPEDNSQAYRISDVTAKAEKLRNKKLLIVHGTAGKSVTTIGTRC